jgi:hypothetical protein
MIMELLGDVAGGTEKLENILKANREKHENPATLHDTTNFHYPADSSASLFPPTTHQKINFSFDSLLFS